jgi:ribosomal protein L9
MEKTTSHSLPITIFSQKLGQKRSKNSVHDGLGKHFLLKKLQTVHLTQKLGSKVHTKEFLHL